ncbi:Regulatory factor X 1/2/3 [Fasciola gigantica]|uniref:Regulatory factor X 1/2/3 n=1 Tax=Fasciola gigantica TaxID=46835 RepID=A0A504YYN5_FASGI|nr:Regulatory factor X 1/2/3 [Fasciola gigantica]
MQSASGQTATIVQVSSKAHNATPTVIQQNGQHLVLGKLSGGAIRPVTTAADLQISHSSANQSIYPSHYIEAIAEQTVYATNGENGPVQYQGYTPIIYAPVTGGQTYYQTASGQVLASAFSGTNAGGVGSGVPGHVSNLGAQLVTHQGATYLVQGGQLEEDSSSISHTAKASPVTVQWLVENYETAEGVSLPRSTLYFHYLQHCNENKLEPMNPASFGKLIRSVFFGLRTRRLGTRGNSKYHYYGIRIKPNSPLNHFVEDAGFSLRHYPNYHRQTMEAAAEWKCFANSSSNRLKSSSLNSAGVGTTHSSLGSHLNANSTSSAHMGSQQVHTTNYNTNSRSEKSYEPTVEQTNQNSQLSARSATNNLTSTCTTGSTIAVGSGGQHQHAQFLGEASSALPNLDEICRSAGLPVPGETDLSSFATEATTTSKPKGKIGNTSLDFSFYADIVTFCRLYALSASYMLDAVVNLDFTAIETVWKAFWRTEEVQDSQLKQSLSQERLHLLVSDSAVIQFVRLYDHTFYQSLAEVLIPNVLRPIPPTLTQAIRNFAKSLEGWMRQATQGLEPTLVNLKLSAVSALAQTLRRYTSLNHLAQAARAVLKNSNQINQMLTDLNRVDFNNVQEQASWVCQCSDATVGQLEQDFKRILHKHASLEEWAQWLDNVVSSILQPLEGNSLAYTRAAHQLILKWSFYSSMVIRDLTLRSAASFGSFHLIRLLYDEYIFYLVEHKVAAHLGMTPVAVMGEMGRDLTQQHYAQSRLPSDVISRKEIVPNTTSETPSNFTYLGHDNAALRHDGDYLSYTPSGRAKLDPVAVSAVADDDEEVDEYLDDEEDVDDSTGDEGAMLKHAHASVQAYCRSTTSTSTKLESLAFTSSTSTVGPHDSVETNCEETTVSTALVPPVSEEDTSGGDVATEITSDNTAVALPDKGLIPAEPDTDQKEAQNLSGMELTVGSEPSCSPPPILTAPNPVRKVVRVTTFCDATPVNEPVSAPLSTSSLGPALGSSSAVTNEARCVPAEPLLSSESTSASIHIPTVLAGDSENISALPSAKRPKMS